VAAAVRQIAGRDNQPNLWQFALADDRTVTYRALPGEVERDEHIGGKAVRHESYTLPDGCTFAIAVEPGALPQIVSMTVTRPPTPSAGSRRQEIVARLGKDNRFANPPAGGQ
jgi:hypothetical protein